MTWSILFAIMSLYDKIQCKSYLVELENDSSPREKVGSENLSAVENEKIKKGQDYFIFDPDFSKCANKTVSQNLLYLIQILWICVCNRYLCHEIQTYRGNCQFKGNLQKPNRNQNLVQNSCNCIMQKEPAICKF